MQVIIPAAGMGKRLGHLTDSCTKCMVDVSGKTLINRCLDILSEYDVDRFIIVLGYEGDKLKQFIGDEYNGIDVEYVWNRDYDKTNNIYSVYLAKDFLSEDDTLLIESDLIFNEKVIKRIMSDKSPNSALVAKYVYGMDGAVLELDENRRIQRFTGSKFLGKSESDNYYKTVNIYKFSKEFMKNTYIPFMKAYIKSEGMNEYYEQVLNLINFIDKKYLRACILAEDELWYEIDNLKDLKAAEKLFPSSLKKASSI